MTLDEGDRCVCTYDRLYNFFGKRHEALREGMHLTVKDRMRFGGLFFLAFRETDDAYFQADFFMPERMLN